jgi:hypothetical protein
MKVVEHSTGGDEHVESVLLAVISDLKSTLQTILKDTRRKPSNI